MKSIMKKHEYNIITYEKYDIIYKFNIITIKSNPYILKVKKIKTYLITLNFNTTITYSY